MLKEVVETCPFCECENILKWDVKANGFVIKCLHCGSEMMLCDECLHSDDNKCQKCDWHREGNMSVCFRRRHLQVGWYIELEEGNGCKKWECSECKGIFRSSQKPWYKFCPHCGIKFINKEDCK